VRGFVRGFCGTKTAWRPQVLDQKGFAIEDGSDGCAQAITDKNCLQKRSLF
jgi:hypothetical protein